LDTIARREATEAELTRLIEKRVQADDPEAEHELRKASVRRHHEKIRQQHRWEWVRYFDRMAESHARLSESYRERAEALVDQGAA
jgi:hypothetical protein